MNTGAELLAGILTQPDCDTAPVVLADWLQENGAESLAVAIRAAVSLRRSPTLYVVSAGSYSDYHIEGIFSTRDGALRFIQAAEKLNTYSDFNDIEKYTLDGGLSHIEAGRTAFRVQMLADGNEALASPLVTTATEDDPKFHNDFWHNNKPRQRVFIVLVWAKDAAHAIKIANEKRIVLLASPVPAS